MSRLAMVAVGMGCVLAVTATAGAAPEKKGGGAMARFPYPTGKVSYKFNSSIGTGTVGLSWIENGKKFRQETQLALSRGEQKTSVGGWVIYDGTYLYTHQATMGKNVFRSKPQQAANNFGVGLPMANNANKGKLVGKASILGKPCEVRESETKVGKVKVWTWKSLPLKVHVEPAEGQTGPTVEATATAVQSPAKLPASAFKLPAGYTVVGPGTRGGAGRMGMPPGARGVVPVR